MALLHVVCLRFLNRTPRWQKLCRWSGPPNLMALWTIHFGNWRNRSRTFVSGNLSRASQRLRKQKCGFCTRDAPFILAFIVSIRTRLASSPANSAAMLARIWMTTSRFSSTRIMTGVEVTSSQVNPLGTQMDGLIVEEQRDNSDLDFDTGWDGVWSSNARIVSNGWTVTIEIPFTTLNFTHSTEVLWGLNFKRFIRRKNEEDLWRAYRRTFGITKVSQAGDLRGIENIGSGRLFVVKPYALARYDQQTGQDAKSPLTGGVDVKYGLTSNLVLNLTGNTDFADAEVDLQPFNLTPFKVFIPEKRQFFLENAGVFNFDIGDQDQLFFSRQIGIDPVTGQQVPINGGARLTGTIGRTELGIMEVDTRSSGPNPYANYAVARLKESLWGGSYVGVMGIDKRSGNPLE